MVIRTLPEIQRTLPASTTEVFFPLTPYYPTLECLLQLSVVLALTSKSGNFQCRLGIQTAATDEDEGTAPVNPASASSQVTSLTKTYLRFDPNGATEGNIDGAAFFRLGVFVSVASGNPATGTVVLRSLSWR